MVVMAVIFWVYLHSCVIDATTLGGGYAKFVVPTGATIFGWVGTVRYPGVTNFSDPPEVRYPGVTNFPDPPEVRCPGATNFPDPPEVRCPVATNVLGHIRVF
jgi:hypothetical protein